MNFGCNHQVGIREPSYRLGAYGLVCKNSRFVEEWETIWRVWGWCDYLSFGLGDGSPDLYNKTIVTLPLEGFSHLLFHFHISSQHSRFEATLARKFQHLDNLGRKKGFAK